MRTAARLVPSSTPCVLPRGRGGSASRGGAVFLGERGRGTKECCPPWEKVRAGGTDSGPRVPSSDSGPLSWEGGSALGLGRLSAWGGREAKLAHEAAARRSSPKTCFPLLARRQKTDEPVDTFMDLLASFKNYRGSVLPPIWSRGFPCLVFQDFLPDRPGGLFPATHLCPGRRARPCSFPGTQACYASDATFRGAPPGEVRRRFGGRRNPTSCGRRRGQKYG